MDDRVPKKRLGTSNFYNLQFQELEIVIKHS